MPDELREYDVLVKQKPSGKVAIRIARTADDTTVVTTDTTVEAHVLLMKYRYEYHGREAWRADRLLRLESRTNDDGKSLAVNAAAEGNGSRIEVKGKAAATGPALVMTSNYWRLPDARVLGNKFSIIDSDTGRLFGVKLQYVGPETISVEGRPIACEHFRVSGDTAAELWFDGERRLVRQQTVEQGYTTELRLARPPDHVSALTAADWLIFRRVARRGSEHTSPTR